MPDGGEGDEVGVIACSGSSCMGGGGNIDACCTLNERVAVFSTGGGDSMKDGEGGRGREGKVEGNAEGEGEGLTKGGREGDAVGIGNDGDLDFVNCREGKKGEEGKGVEEPVGEEEKEGEGETLDNSKRSSKEPGGGTEVAAATATKYTIFCLIEAEI